jgi:hypothetical protein
MWACGQAGGRAGVRACGDRAGGLRGWEIEVRGRSRDAPPRAGAALLPACCCGCGCWYPCAPALRQVQAGPM